MSPRLSVIHALANAVVDNADTYHAGKALIGTKLTARAIRQAFLPVRYEDLAHIKQITNAEYYQAFDEVYKLSTTTPSEEATMQNTTNNITVNANTPVDTVTTVYGRDASKLSKSDLIDAISETKYRIKTLTDVGVSSSYIDSEVVKLQDALAKLIALLDA